MLTRRRFLTRGTLGMGVLAGTALGFPGDGSDKPDALPDGSASKGMITDTAERAIDRGLDITLGGGLDLEQQLFVEVFRTDDAKTGVASFLEHGPGKADFQGR